MRRLMVFMMAVTMGVALLTGSQLAAQRTASGPARRSPIALLDVSAVTQSSMRFKNLMEGLKKEYVAKAEVLKKEGESGNAKTEELRKLKPNSPEYKALEQDILKLRADYELHGKRMTEEIRDAEAKIVMSLMADVKHELARYAQANGVPVVIRTDPSPPELTDARMILQEIHKPIVYSRGNDVTPVILEALNGRGSGPAATTARPGANRPAPR